MSATRALNGSGEIFAGHDHQKSCPFPAVKLLINRTGLGVKEVAGLTKLSSAFERPGNHQTLLRSCVLVSGIKLVNRAGG